MKIWKDEEVKALFYEVEDCKKGNTSLKVAFEKHAKNFKRKPNSVRNYYYKEVDNLLLDKKRCGDLGIDLEKHKKTHFICFEKQESENIVLEIEKLTKLGMSVRSACYKLANGDLARMTRLQNKYQNMKKNNIIPFRNKQKLLSENEINSLFLGLVRLIKKTAIEEFSEKVKQGEENLQVFMKKAFSDLNKKDEKIAQLQQAFDEVKKENQELIAKLKLNEKKQSLKKHLSQKHFSEMMEN